MITPAEIRHIVNLIEELYKNNDIKLETVVKIEGDETELLINNREDRDIN